MKSIFNTANYKGNAKDEDTRIAVTESGAWITNNRTRSSDNDYATPDMLDKMRRAEQELRATSNDWDFEM